MSGTGTFRSRSGLSVRESLKKTLTAIEENARKALDEAAQVGVEAVRETLGHPGHPDHPAAPGLAPHLVSGALRESAVVLTPSESVRRISVGGESAPYAASLELGSRSTGIHPHPFLRPSIERCRNKMLERFKASMKKNTP